MFAGRYEIRLQEGYRYAIQFDGDGQHSREYIEAMRQKMEEGYGTSSDPGS